MEHNEKDIILITGFGPFGDHKINASWESVKLLENFQTEKYKILTKEIPVQYNYVEETIPNLWKELKPSLVIHVGVASFYNNIVIETVAHRTGYFKPDICGLYPNKCICTTLEDVQDQLQTEINVADLCLLYKKNCNNDISVSQSTNAGRYLCEYTFFQSLSQDKSRTLFVHVPALEKYSAQQISEVLSKIADLAYNMVNQRTENEDNFLLETKSAIS